MKCDHDIGKNGREFFDRFYAKVDRDRIPIMGGIELTSRCNLNCIHCYASRPANKGNRTLEELTAGHWIHLIDQMTDAGCLFLLFTGGETLLRNDFPEIYQHARKNGLLVTVFTNGTCISGKVMDAFEVYPPHSVEISLYGASASTYERVTGVAGSFEKCMRGISRLTDQGVNLKLKTMLMSVNFAELEDMERLADGIGAQFRFDPLISARLDGDPAPLNFRVNPELAVEKEFFDQKRAKQQHDFFFRMSRHKITSDLYQCGAGVNMFHIDSSGMIQPCLMVAGVDQNLLRMGFQDAWNSEDFSLFREKQVAPVQCRQCDKKAICGYCPGFFQLESGSTQVASEYLCNIGRMRKQAILNFHLEAKQHEYPMP